MGYFRKLDKLKDYVRVYDIPKMNYLHDTGYGCPECGQLIIEVSDNNLRCIYCKFYAKYKGD